MKNKFIQTLLVSATIAITMSSMAFAANWSKNENNEWRYYDKNGSVITESWAKSNDNWYYVDNNGAIITDTILEDDDNYYYLDSTGVMIRNSWIKYNDDWYYFGKDGKAYLTKKDEITSSSLKEINGKKYAFDTEGKMLYGWIDASSIAMVDEDDEDGWKEALYYAGDPDDGAITIGWRQISVEDDEESKDYWFFFKPTGKKSLDEKKTINGVTYRFNTEDGHMLSEWAPVATASNIASSSNMTYMNEDGAMVKKGWIWAVPDEDYIQEDYDNDEYSWWYAENSGKIVKNTIKKINGKHYAFDEMGRMLYGLVTTEDGEYVNKSGDTEYIDFTGDQIKESDFEKLYYFSASEEDGSRKDGTVKIELEDDTYNFYFKNNGLAENGYVSKIKKFVKNGIILEAKSDEGKFAGVDAEYDSGYKLNSGNLSYGNEISEGQILINTNGAIVKNKNNVNDGNDVYIFTDKNGVVLYVGDKLKSKKDGSIEIKGKTYEID